MSGVLEERITFNFISQNNYALGGHRRNNCLEM